MSEIISPSLSVSAKKIVQSVIFQNFILCIIIFGSIQVGLETYNTKWNYYLEIIDNIIMFVFLSELALKLLAEGKEPWRYFKDGWNWIDFLVVLIYFLPFNAKFITVARLIRLLRVLRVITFFPQLRLIVGSLLKAIPSMIYVFSILLIHFYVYACAGTTLFGKNDPFHFGNLHISMVTLFRAVTLEDWADIMYVNMYGCDKISYEGTPLCVSPVAQPITSVIYFISFIFTGAMIILNMLIGVIINGIDEVKEETKNKEMAQKKELDNVTVYEEMQLIQQKLSEFSQEFQHLAYRIGKLQDKKVDVRNFTNRRSESPQMLRGEHSNINEERKNISEERKSNNEERKNNNEERKKE